MPKRLKRRFGKDNQRPIVQKFDKDYANKYDQIDWLNKENEVKENDNISKTDNR